MGSPDCSQCLGREDLGHLCVWSDGCRLRGTLQPLPDTCPAPEIRAVSTPPPPPPSEAVAPTCLNVHTYSAPRGLRDPQYTCLHTPRPMHTVLPPEHLLGARPCPVLETQQGMKQVPAFSELMF